MELTAFLDIATKALLLTGGAALLLLLLAVVDVLAHAPSQLRADPQSRANTIGSIVVIAALFVVGYFVLTQYQISQDQRRAHLSLLRGISQDIDAKIDAAQLQRISYRHAFTIEEAARESCVRSASSLRGEAITACRAAVLNDRDNLISAPKK